MKSKSVCISFKFKIWPDASSTKEGKKKEKRKGNFVSKTGIPFRQRNFITRLMIFFHCHNKLSTHLDTITQSRYSRVVRWPTAIETPGFDVVNQVDLIIMTRLQSGTQEGFSVITTPNSTRCWDESKECGAPLYDILPSPRHIPILPCQSCQLSLR